MSNKLTREDMMPFLVGINDLMQHADPSHPGFDYDPDAGGQFMAQGANNAVLRGVNDPEMLRQDILNMLTEQQFANYGSGGLPPSEVPGVPAQPAPPVAPGPHAQGQAFDEDTMFEVMEGENQRKLAYAAPSQQQLIMPPPEQLYVLPDIPGLPQLAAERLKSMRGPR